MHEYYTHNGMNLTKSVKNPNSRFRKVYDYLSKNGPRTKREILRDVFGKTIRVGRWTRGVEGVTLGWGSYVFTLGVKNGYFKKVRSSGTVFWKVTP